MFSYTLIKNTSSSIGQIKMIKPTIAIYILISTLMLIGCQSTPPVKQYKIAEKYNKVALGDKILLIPCVDLRNELRKLEETEFNSQVCSEKFKSKIQKIAFRVVLYRGKPITIDPNNKLHTNFAKIVSAVSENPEINWIVIPYIAEYKRNISLSHFSGTRGVVGMALYDRSTKTSYWNRYYPARTKTPLFLDEENYFFETISEKIKDDFLTK